MYQPAKKDGIRAIAIIDYDVGNLRGVEEALTALREKPVTTSDSHETLSADKVIPPGVGSFGDATRRLHQYGLVDVICQITDQGTPSPGTCLGLQLTSESSKEDVGVEGLGLLRGTVREVPDCPGLKIPHMGWNPLDATPGTRLSQGMRQGAYMYFVHSYYLEAGDEKTVATSTRYSTRVHASVESGSMFTCQSHPEKSSSVGLWILKNSIKMNQNLTL